MTIPKQLLEAKICNKNTCELNQRIDKAIEKLKEHKQDLDYEPWSIYKIDENILFDLVNILEGNDNNE